MSRTRVCKAAGIAFDGRVEADVLTLRQNGNSVIAEIATEQDQVAGTSVGGGELYPRAHASDPGGIDEDAVAAALLDHLGVARYDLDARRFGGLTHRSGDARQHVDGQSLFDDERGGKEERFGAAHGEIVDRAVNRERADVAAAEEERLDDEAVRRKGETLGAHLQHRLVVQPSQDGTAEHGKKDLAQEIRTEFAARSVAEQDAVLGRERSWAGDHTVRRKR